jgi:GT2 family glycosyltransferase
VLQGAGNLFWNRGMHQGMAWAMAQPHDHLLWLNDDTTLRPDALHRLLREQQQLALSQGRPVVLVGATAGPDGQLSYGGGCAHSGLRRFRYTPVWDAQHPVRCHAMNGNCVLLPAALVQVVGNIDPVYEHAMGDTDYALRAARAGFSVWVASGLVGDCSNNVRTGTFHDASLPLRQRWAAMMSRKGLPWRSWLHFTRQHGGWLWPLHFAWPYLRMLLSSLFRPAASSSSG